MVRNLKWISIAICVACVAGILPAIRGRDALESTQAQPRSVGPENDQAQAVTILLEAFVVEVNLPALDELDVSPIGQPPHSVSVENILTCLDRHQASLVVGAKEAVRDRESGEVKATRTTYVKRNMPPQARVPNDYTPYDAGTRLSVRAAVLSQRSLQVSYSFSSRVFAPPSETENVPPDTESWEWEGDVLLRPGEPAIAAATQDRQRGLFLLLTAHVQDQ